jgi:hypothetical protein
MPRLQPAVEQIVFARNDTVGLLDFNEDQKADKAP